MFFKRHNKTTAHANDSQQDTGQTEHSSWCVYIPEHVALIHDGWEHATLYHHMLCQASQARWTIILPGISTLASGGITLCPLMAHPQRNVREHGHIAAAVGITAATKAA